MFEDRYPYLLKETNKTRTCSSYWIPINRIREALGLYFKGKTGVLAWTNC